LEVCRERENLPLLQERHFLLKDVD